MRLKYRDRSNRVKYASKPENLPLDTETFVWSGTKDSWSGRWAWEPWGIIACAKIHEGEFAFKALRVAREAYHARWAVNGSHIAFTAWAGRGEILFPGRCCGWDNSLFEARRVGAVEFGKRHKPSYQKDTWHHYVVTEFGRKILAFIEENRICTI